MSEQPPVGGPGRRPDEATQAIPPTGGDPTRRSAPGDHDATRALPPTPAPGSTGTAWEAEVPAHGPPTGAHATYPGSLGDPGPDDERPERSRLRDLTVGLVGAVLGFVLAFLVVALSTGGEEPALVDDGSSERIESLEADVAERDARIEELEAQLAEAAAAAGDRDADIAAQLQALDERASALEDRASALDERETAVAQREAGIAEREQAVAARERALDEADAPPAPPAPPGDEPGGGIDLPQIDTEELDNLVERILDQIRNLF